MLYWISSGTEHSNGDKYKLESFFILGFKPLTIFIPRTIRKKYEDQKDLQYTFTTKDGSLEVSKFGLQHSEFYSQHCEGPDVFFSIKCRAYTHSKITVL